MNFILKWIGAKAMKALAVKLFMVYIVPWIFDKIIGVLEKMAKSTETQVDDVMVEIQKDARQKYLDAIENEF